MDEFAYPGITIDNYERNKSEIIKHLCQAKIVINNKKNLLASSDISLKTRKNLLKNRGMWFSPSWM